MRLLQHVSALAVLMLMASACTPTPAAKGVVPTSSVPTAVPLLQEQTDLFQAEPTSIAAAANPAASSPVTAITIDTKATPVPIDPRLFGTNVPAWLGPDRLRSPKLIQEVKALGTTVLRMPGGSWSNAYSWLGCENADKQQCFWTWAARPSDFIGFLRATGLEGMWTVSPNGTAQEAAALVAFFNGSVSDTTVIGTDVRGQDWKTVGHWAQLRADHGNPAPVGIKLWEVGNELYGGKPTSGKDCASWGWEDVWTCDGSEYVQGIGSGNTAHDGYLAFRSAMRAVDPTIQVGAVGVPAPGDWSNWGNEVITGAGNNLDFYVVHRYAYDKPPSDIADVLAQPQRIWPRMASDLQAAFADTRNGHTPPIALTEYNLFAFREADTGQFMKQAVNALYTTDTLGQLAQHGVAIANQWNLTNGPIAKDSDYALFDAETGDRLPAYYALPLWRQVGSELLPVKAPFPADTTLSIYAGRSADGTLALLAINKTAEPISTQVQLNGDSQTRRREQTVVGATSLTAATMAVNGVTNPTGALSTAGVAVAGTITGAFDTTFAPFSITLIRMPPA